MAILEKFFIERDKAALVVIDVQEKLCTAMDQQGLERLTKNVGILLEAARELGMPVVATEQYTKGLGPTIEPLSRCIPNPALEKMTFSCCGDDSFLQQLADTGRKQVVVVGMETHVCVLQTILELLERGYVVHVVEDAVLSRSADNRRIGLSMAAAAGGVVTCTETVLFQLLRVAGTEEFRKLSKLVR